MAISTKLQVYTAFDDSDDNDDDGTVFHLCSWDEVNNAIKKVSKNQNVNTAESIRRLTCAILVQSYDYEEPNTSSSFSVELWSHLQKASSIDLIHAKRMIEDLFRMYQARSMLVDVQEASHVIRRILTGDVHPETLADAWMACQGVFDVFGSDEANLEHASRIKSLIHPTDNDNNNVGDRAT